MTPGSGQATFAWAKDQWQTLHQTFGTCWSYDLYIHNDINNDSNKTNTGCKNEFIYF